MEHACRNAIRAAGVVWLAALLWAPRATSGASPSCVDVAKAPQKYAGVRVAFFGSATGFSTKVLDGKAVVAHPWACKDEQGKLLGASFGEIGAQFSDAAKNVNMFKSLFKVTGLVKGVSSEIQGTAMPLLTDASVELVTEVK